MASKQENLGFIPYFKQLLELLETTDELKKTSKGVLSQMAWAAGGAGVGGLVAGPPGALVGGIAGSVIGYCKSDNYSSMMDVLKALTDEEKQNLVNEVQGLVGSTSLEDLTAFVGTQAERESLINCIRQFVNTAPSPSRGNPTPDSDAPPPYSSVVDEPRVPSAPPYPAEGLHTDRAPYRTDPPPPYSADRIYPNLNVHSTEKSVYPSVTNHVSAIIPTLLQ